MSKVSQIEVLPRNSGYPHGSEKSEFTVDEFEVPEWPKLNDHTLFGLAGEFVELATQNSEADPAAVLITLLVRFAVEVGPGPFLMVGDTKHNARISAVLVGATSKARKGTSARPVQRLFELQQVISSHPGLSMIEYEPARASPGPLSSGEGIIFNVRDESQEWNAKKGDFIKTDPGIIDKRLFIQDEEFAGALTCTKREGNTLSTILRSAWDNGNIEPLTKTSRIKATGAHIGICTHITLPELHQKLNEVEAFNGFANRLLWGCARRSKIIPFPEPMPFDKLTALQNRLLDIISKAHTCGQVQLDCYARELWKKEYPELTRDRGGLIGAVTNRAEAQVLRLSMIYALLDGDQYIRTPHLEAALTLWDYCEASARFIFSGRDSNPYANRILEALNGGPKSTTDLHNVFSRKLRSEELQKAIKELISQGKIECYKEATMGKPKTLFRLT